MSDFFCAECSAKIDALVQALGLAKSPASDQLAQVVAFSSKAKPTAKASPKTKHDYEDPWFQGFWKVYPRKIAKKPAFDQFNKALRNGANPQAIIDAASVFAAVHRRKQTDLSYIPYPDKWLRHERWNDEPEQMAVVDTGPAIGSPEWQAERDADFERIKRELA